MVAEFTGYLAIVVALVFLEKGRSLAPSHLERCRIYDSGETLDCSHLNFTKIPEDIFATKYDKMCATCGRK